MKSHPSSFFARAALVRFIVVAACVGLHPLNLTAGMPNWWSQRNVVQSTGTDAALVDYAAANQGQLKKIATAAFDELNSNPAIGVGDMGAPNGTGYRLTALINSWSTRQPDGSRIPILGSNTTDYAPVNLGQLKSVASLFYKRLIEVGYTTNYPWTGGTANDYAMANIGQVKNLFKFDLSNLSNVTLPASGYSQFFNIPITVSAGGDSWIRYTLDGSDPSNNSPGINTSTSLQINFRSHFKAQLFVGGNAVGPIQEAYYLIQGKTLFAKGDYTVALAASGTTWVWGKNQFGQMGLGTTAKTGVLPLASSSLFGISGIGTGLEHCLGFLGNGQIQSWGDNSYGQLGVGTQIGTLNPSLVSGSIPTVGIAAGDGFSIALDGSGNVFTWGDGSSGQLGRGNSVNWSFVPVKVTGLPQIQTIAAGRSSAYAIDQSGKIWVWGASTYSQIGDFGMNGVASPTLLSGFSGTAIAISAGAAHALVLTADGKVYSFGSNWYGQLGRNNRSADAIPGLVQFNSPQPTIIAIASGDYHCLALASDGSVYAWGSGWSGQNGSYVDQIQPQKIIGNGIMEIAAGRYHSVALGGDGRVYAWGDNTNDQLGVTLSGSAISTSTPLQVSNLPPLY